MLSFDFQLRTRIIFGAGTVDRIGEMAVELGAKRVLMVSDAGIVKAGHAPRGLASLAAAGLTTELFQDVHENPSTLEVEKGVALAKAFQPDLLVGLGGGSSMDCAKGINFVYTGGGRMQDYWGTGKATKPMLPMIAVPTTSGTGSETQSFALISDAETHVKMACGDKKASCRIAVLDPSLTASQPARVTAVTGIDACAHALETYVTRVRTPISLAYSREAWRLCSHNLPRVLEEPQDLDARGGMHLGACLAGVAIENSMLGATHACANPLTARYGIVHGQAIAIMLPHVIRFNGVEFEARYRELEPHGSARLAERVSELADQAGLALKLRDLGVTEDSLPGMAAEAEKQWTGTFNPRPVKAPELLELYRAAF